MVEFTRSWLSNVYVIEKEMGRLLDYFGSSKPPKVHFAPGVWGPAIDVYETEEELVVLVELAGVRREDIELVADSTTLVVRGERRESPSGKRRSYSQMEIPKGPFERVISLPTAINPDQTRAYWENGLLEILLPKLLEEKTHRVRIITNSG